MCHTGSVVPGRQSCAGRFGGHRVVAFVGLMLFSAAFWTGAAGAVLLWVTVGVGAGSDVAVSGGGMPTCTIRRVRIRRVGRSSYAPRWR
jgi:hypothetical protein